MIIDFNRYNGGGGSGSGVTPEQVQAQIDSALTPYWESGETKDYVDEAVSGISLDGYWTSAQTEDAISAATSGKADAVSVTANTNNLKFPYWNEQGVITGSYYKGATTKGFGVNGTRIDFFVGAGSANLPDFYAPLSAGTAGDILVSTGDAPVWSAMTFPTPDVDKAYVDSAITAVEDHLYDVEQVTASALTELHEGLVEVSGRPSPDMSLYTPTSGFSTINGSAITNGGNIVIQSDLADYWTSGETKAYVDSAITGVQDQIDVMDEVVATSLVDLNDRIVELSGSSVDLSAYYTSAQTEDAISAATSGKADKANVTARNSDIPSNGPLYIPKWNEEGIITGDGSIFYRQAFYVNGVAQTKIYKHNSNTIPPIYAPVSAGTAGDILVSAGYGNAPVWSAVTFSGGGVSQEYVDSGDTNLQNQIDVMDEVVSDALNDLNGRMASKVSSASVSTIWRGTQAEYNAIATKDPATLYIIL